MQSNCDLHRMEQMNFIIYGCQMDFTEFILNLRRKRKTGSTGNITYIGIHTRRRSDKIL